MIRYVERFLWAMRGVFSRQAAWVWFVVVFVGLAVRGDTFGVSSIVRALALSPACYVCLLHFFHSTAWQAETLFRFWWQWLARENVGHRVNGRAVLIGDHTKTPKDGRRIPEVTTLHQDSETNSKPSFFRGHHWGAIALLVAAGKKFFGTPLWAEIHRDDGGSSRTTRLVSVAADIAHTLGGPAYLVLDAFFAVGPVFEIARSNPNTLRVLTRAKKNVVAYLPPPPPRSKPRRGRPRKYGKKLSLMTLFDSRHYTFQSFPFQLYHRSETVHALTVDLLWKPVKTTLRFFLIESSRGRLILMTDDLTLSASDALFLYCRRPTIETLFDTLKNLVGAMGYHFWSRYLRPSSRRPLKATTPKPTSTRPDRTANTLAAIEKFLAVQITVVGLLHLLARRAASEIFRTAFCWLRTPCGPTPSVFVTRTAISNAVYANLRTFATDAMTRLILAKQRSTANTSSQRKVA
jgi:hypothetical protein